MIRFDRVRQLPVPSFLLLLLGLVAGVDFLLGVICDPIPLWLPLLILIPVVMLSLASVADPKKQTIRLALALGSIAVGLYVAEGIFTRFLLTPAVPQAKQAFCEEIASDWPHPITKEKKPGTFRIIGLSDSFGVAGGGGNYHYLLENLLRADGIDVEVVNLSGSAFNLLQELEMLQRHGADYQPDLVLHGFFVGNDFLYPKRGFFYYRGVTLFQRDAFLLSRPRLLYICAWLRKSVARLWDRSLKKAERARGEDVGKLSRSKFLKVERRRLELCRVRPKQHRMYRQATVLLEQIVRQARQMGVQYVMVIHPDQFQVDPNLLEQVVEKQDLLLDEYDLEAPQRFLRRLCAERQLPCLDLLPVFELSGSARDLYRFRDTHYNREGNALAAAAIRDFLKDKGLLPPKTLVLDQKILEDNQATEQVE